MRKENRYTGTPMLTRFGLVVLATVIGLILTLAVVAAQTLPNFGDSTKSGPEYARPNETITYTIVAVNTGAAVQNVILSDVLPSGVTFVPGSCIYNDSDDPDWFRSCDPQSPAHIWEQDFPSDRRITTTFAVTVTTGTSQLPLVNHAYLGWDGGQKEIVWTTTVLSAIPVFSSSNKYKSGPQVANTGDVITYTIIAVNAGDPVTGVVLLDPLPGGVEFVPGSCTYDKPGTLGIRCSDSFSETLWQEDFTTVASRITTTFAVTVTAGTSRFSVQNCAYLEWNILQEEMCVTILLNPYAYVYLPLVLRNYPPQPVGSVEIVSENDYLYRPSVTLSLTATAPGDASDQIQMCISNDSSCTSWITLTEQITDWDLAEGVSGPRTVYAQFKGSKGGVSDLYFDRIYLTWNGDFEDINWGDHWSHGKGPFQGHGTGLDQSIVLADGSNRARLGDPGSQDGSIPVGYAYVSQTFKVPDSNPRLLLDYYVHSWDTVWGASTPRYYDTFELSLNRLPAQITDQERNTQGCRDPDKLNPAGTLLPSGDGLVFCGGQPSTPPPHEWDSGWRAVTLDLGAFTPGQSITLYVATWNREYSTPFVNDQGYFNTYSYVDNVTILGD